MSGKRELRLFWVAVMAPAALSCNPQMPVSGRGLAPDTLGGTVEVTDLTIPSGTTTRVTSDVVINASGDVTIEGNLVADSSSSNGYSITINAEGDVDIGGMIQAGDGVIVGAAAGRADRVLAAADGEEGDGEEGEGHETDPEWAGKDGGSVEIHSGRGIVLRQWATLQAGNGSDGQYAREGNWGGMGGSILLRAQTKITIRGSIYIGNGGHGGRAESTLQCPPPDWHMENRGGRSGLFLLDGANFDMPGLRMVQPNVYAINPVEYTANKQTGMLMGGVGGSAGIVSVSDFGPEFPFPFFPVSQASGVAMHALSNGDSECPSGFECVYAAGGGWGWFMGGGGSYTTVAAGLSLETIHGMSWVVYGGNGGDVDESLAVETGYVPVVIADGAQGGPGGSVSVTAPPGALGVADHLSGGNGGSAYAYAGDGGNGSFYAEQAGGKGGDAMAFAGNGGKGHSDGCGPGSGGHGGDALAIAGWGGDGAIPGSGGTATALGGAGGAGGIGSPQTGGGAGGTGGTWQFESGGTGADSPDVTAQPGGPEDRGAAEDGEPGGDYFICTP